MFEMPAIVCNARSLQVPCRPKNVSRHFVISKKKNCNPYFIVIMIAVLIMIGIFWVVNFKTRNYFVIFYYTERLPKVIYVRLL
jgi:hypothetical protein